jgi:hypothetical protein
VRARFPVDIGRTVPAWLTGVGMGGGRGRGARRLPLAATGGMDGKLCIWDLTTYRARHVLQHAVRQGGVHASVPLVLCLGCTPGLSGVDRIQDGITRLVWHATEPIVYTAAVDGVRRCWGPGSGRPPERSGCAHAQMIRVWDARSGACLHTLQGHRSALLDMTITTYVLARRPPLHTGTDHARACMHTQGRPDGAIVQRRRGARLPSVVYTGRPTFITRTWRPARARPRACRPLPRARRPPHGPARRPWWSAPAHSGPSLPTPPASHQSVARRHHSRVGTRGARGQGPGRAPRGARDGSKGKGAGPRRTGHNLGEDLVHLLVCFFVHVVRVSRLHCVIHHLFNQTSLPPRTPCQHPHAYAPCYVCASRRGGWAGRCTHV